MASYLKDKKIEIWRHNEDSVNSNGIPETREEKLHTGAIWAYYRHVSSKETYAAMSVQYREDAVFILNHREGIDPRTDYIVYNGRKYDINGIDDFQGGKGDIRISAKVRKY